MFVAIEGAQFVTLVVIVSLKLLFERAEKGQAPYVRRLAALGAIDTAIHRATEMGRAAHFTIGFSQGTLPVTGE
jgi:predicted protein tyrosine phosphatase